VPLLAAIGALIIGLVLGACGVGAAVAAFGDRRHDRGGHSFQHGPRGSGGVREGGRSHGGDGNGNRPDRGPAPTSAVPAPSSTS
jgi:hypothetical protein